MSDATKPCDHDKHARVRPDHTLVFTMNVLLCPASTCSCSPAACPVVQGRFLHEMIAGGAAPQSCRLTCAPESPLPLPLELDDACMQLFKWLHYMKIMHAGLTHDLSWGPWLAEAL